MNLFMIYISSVSYNVLINKALTNKIHPKKGFEIRCPVSLYLFVLCQNVLSLMINKAKIEKRIHGIKISRRSIPISHLHFVGDNYLFFKANKESCFEIKRILDRFYKYSRLQINFGRSKVLPSNNCHPKFKRMFKSIS